MLVSVIALVVGALVAIGAYALIDGTDSATQVTKYIVVEQQAQGSADIPGKNEAATAAAVSPQTGVASPDEAATAVAISQSGGVELPGSNASSSGTSEQDVVSSATAFSGQR
jgi:hypothetical protein